MSENEDVVDPLLKELIGDLDGLVDVDTTEGWLALS